MRQSNLVLAALVASVAMVATKPNPTEALSTRFQNEMKDKLPEKASPPYSSSSQPKTK